MVLFLLFLFLFLQTPSTSLASDCQGRISVRNAYSNVSSSQPNQFTVTIENLSDRHLTVNVHDEIWIDRNCNGVADPGECQQAGFQPDCGWGTTNYVFKEWKDVSLLPHSSQNLVWDHPIWAPGMCYLHAAYFYSIPLDSSNACYQGTSAGYHESVAGNLQALHNQAKFSAQSASLPFQSTAYGIVTHLDISQVQQGKSTQDLAGFKRDIDTLVTQSPKTKTVRLAVLAGDIMDFATQGQIYWNPSGLSQVDQALDYAKSHGFSVILALGPWDNPNAWCNQGTKESPVYDPRCFKDGDWRHFHQDLYNDFLFRFYSFLSQRWQGKVAVWNPYNEADQACFSDWLGECRTRDGIIIQDPSPSFMTSDQYIDALKYSLQMIRSTLKQNDPHTLLTAHVGNYPLDYWYFRSVKMFDKIVGQLDIISTSLYPVIHPTNYQVYIDLIPQILDFYTQRYQKPIYVLETGLQEKGGQLCSDTALSEAGGNPSGSRGDILRRILSVIDKHAHVALVYQFRDDKEVVWDCTQFGFRRVDESFKPSFEAFREFVSLHGRSPASSCLVCASVNDKTKSSVCTTPPTLVDFSAWRQAYIQNRGQPSPSQSPLDFNCDSRIDIRDLSYWRQSYIDSRR